MGRKFVTFLLLFLCFSLYGQNETHISGRTFDTIRLQEVTVSYTIPLNNNQIEKFYKTNYFSTIDNLTSHLDGVSLIKRGSYAMEPQLNGFSSGQLNITIDGMKMFGACTDKMDPVTSYIEPTNLESITIEHGTNGSLYGNNIGGSIDLALQEPDRNSAHPFYGSLSSGYESVSKSRNILLSTGYSKDKWAWCLNGVYRKNYLYLDGNGNRIPFSQFEKSNLHSAVKYLADSINSFKADLLYDLATNVGYPALPMDVSRARAGLATIEYERKKVNTNLKAKIYYNSVYHVMDDSKRDSLFFLYNSAHEITDTVIMRMDMPGRSNTFGSFIQATARLNEKNQITVKADNYINNSVAEMTMYMHYIHQPPQPPMYMQTWPEMQRNVTGLFIENMTAFNEKFNMTLNARVDFNIDNLRSPLASEQFSVFNYKLARKYIMMTKGFNISFQYQVTKPLLLSFQSGVSERIPTISELFGFYLYNAYDGYDYIGNPDLKTEKSASGRASVTYAYNGLRINLSQSVSYLRDYIMGITNTQIPPMNFYTNGLRVYANVPGALMASTDLQVKYSPVDGLSLFVLSKYTFGKLKSGEPLPLIPPLKNVISLSYEKNGLLLLAENESALRQNRINFQYGETNTSAYSIYNFKCSYQVKMQSSKIDFSFGITNLFNKEYHEHLDWGGIPRPGRSFNFLLSFSY